MPSLRDVRRRIRSAKNTQKITKALEIVSATKRRRAQLMAAASRPYTEKMEEVIATTAMRAREYRHPLLERREGGRALMILVTTDKGQVGALNVNTLRLANRYLNQNYRGQARIISIGRKGRDMMIRLGREVVADFSGLPDRPLVKEVLPAARVAVEEFMSGRADVILLAYSKSLSTIRQVPTLVELVPVRLPEAHGEDTADYIYEPGPEEVLDQLIPRYLENQLYQAVLESQASEHSARMVAMRNATDAAGDLITSLTLTANKVRQASITAELMEIVSGAEALSQSANK